MTALIQHKRGTAAQWASVNPVLADGEVGYARDTGVIKVGDGVKNWNALTPILASEFLSKTDAVATYLSKTDATSVYLTKSDASVDYLSKTQAGTDYLSKTQAGTDYLSKAQAETDYLSKTQAGTDYVAKSSSESANGVIAPAPSGDATGAADRTALASILNTATGRVILQKGTYYFDATVTVKPGQTLVIPQGTTYRLVSDVVGILMPGSTSGAPAGRLVVDGIIQSPATFTSDLIRIAPSGSGVQVCQRGGVSGQGYIQGPGGGHLATGSGIRLHAVRGTGGAETNAIHFMDFRDFTIVGFGYAIHISTDVTTGAGACWANSNSFHRVIMNNNARDIYIDGKVASLGQTSGNSFIDCKIQLGTHTSKSVYIAGTQNIFASGFIWDAHTAVNATHIIHFAPGSTGNLVESSIQSESNYWVDEGGVIPTPNRVESWAGSVQRNLILPPRASQPGIMYGDQDDVIAFATKRLTVTQTSGPAPSSGGLANMFDLSGESSTRFDAVTVENPVVIEIDMASDPVNYLHFVGMACSFNEYPTRVKMEAWNGTAWVVLLDDTANKRGLITIRAGSIPTVTKLRYTFSVSAAANTYIRVARLFAAGSTPGRAFLPADRQTALTAADSGVVNSGDATTDAVISNMRTRINELETKLRALGALA